ncbi:cupin domain-containing protein [Gordonia sp. CPCC 205515]|uniref:cupin domain-containing protein n=1 Tax=Gordonia sp. CPCC 205515 TaxID=3140791 RepID=UPI003AF38960
MSDQLPEWAQGLGLSRHPEGGWFVETWRSDLVVPKSALPESYPGCRAGGTAIYFLLLPEDRSEWHVVRSAEIWLYHRGSPVLLELGGTADDPGTPTPVVVGPDVAAGHQPQAVVPPNTWQRARPLGDDASLVSCIVVPGFDFEDFRLAGH